LFGANAITSSDLTATTSWQRFSFAFTPASTASLVSGISRDSSNNTADLLVWGAQLELGSTATAFQNIGTDKVSVFTGVTKLSDATKYAVVAELGVRSTAGSFGLYAPSFADGSYSLASQGTLVVEAIQGFGFVPPVTNVVSGLSDIGSDITTVRVNGTSVTNTGDQGTGNFGAYVLYIGRRNNASLPLNGRITQLIVRGALSDTATVAQTERFVAGKTGLVI
jgi:hypothetical protein